MQLRDGLILLGLGAVVVYVLARVLIAQFFAEKRKAQHRLLRDLHKGEEVS